MPPPPNSRGVDRSSRKELAYHVLLTSGAADVATLPRIPQKENIIVVFYVCVLYTKNNYPPYNRKKNVDKS